MTSGYLATRLLEAFEEKERKVEQWNTALAEGTLSSSTILWARFKLFFLPWKRTDKYKKEKKDRKHPLEYLEREADLVAALNDVFWWRWWSGGCLKVIGDTLQTTSPLVSKRIIQFAQKSYIAHRTGVEGPPIGHGIGWAFLLFFMQLGASVCMHHMLYRSMECGTLARGALISAIYRRAMVLSGKARITLNNGRLVNHISTDVSRIDFAAGFFHMGWTSVIQFCVVLAILLVNLGYSALAGVAIIVAFSPVQGQLMKVMFGLRKRIMVYTDQRAKLIRELMNGIKIIKLFAWENPYLEKVNSIRMKELSILRRLLIVRAGNMAVFMSIPLLGSVVGFVVYDLTGHVQNPAVIFTSLTLFQLLRMPLTMLPVSLSTTTDAWNALLRLRDVFTAERKQDMFVIDRSSEWAVDVRDGSFRWEASAPPVDDAKKGKGPGGKGPGGKGPGGPPAEKKKWWKREKKDANKKALPEKKENLDPPMELNNVNLQIPRGQLVAIVGPVGSGKSSLLSALIGEMRRTSGEVIFGGNLGFVAQMAWIQNATLRDNITFGRPFDEERYWQAIHDSCLEPDLEMLPNGDQTEIGEKGINLSGGQRQRVNIARALYFDADVIALDDPLSAVDAHVGRYLFDNAIKGALANKTRLLVTHALHFLPQVDYILVMERGKISERGTYEELMAKGEAFSNLMKDFGGVNEKEEEEEKEKKSEPDEKKRKKFQKGAALMQEEERAAGSVSRQVYFAFAHAGGTFLIIALILSLISFQASAVLSNYWLVWWQGDQFNQSRGFYLGVYASLGVIQTIFAFAMGSCGVLVGFSASKWLHREAIKRVMRSPQSFFDTTPLGRILNRFSKDTDVVDNTLNDSTRMVLNTFGSILGAVVIICIVLPWFLLPVAVIFTVYGFAARFYRSSAREIKRLDNLLRSSLYAHFSESLSGMATIQAYGETSRFIALNEHWMDMENRAYYLTICNQRWLGIRLDFLGALLTISVALLAVGLSKGTVSPSQTGLVLTYVVSISQMLGFFIRQTAEVENDMNSVERLIYYAKSLEQEAPAVIEDKKPEKSWPEEGKVEFERVVMSYRPGLPIILKGISFTVEGGQKVGVVGRTGAGKSSIMMALFRIVEISSGKISIDGKNISEMGLNDLRDNIAIIPQEALLFNGTVRSNLDPFNEYDDARLWDALKRAWLVEGDKVDESKRQSILKEPLEGEDVKEKEGEEGKAKEEGEKKEKPKSRFHLDLVIEDEGLNLSVGERSLVSLARALVKDSKIILLDEATAAVDYETDSRIQTTIRTEFEDKTLLVIAHRIRTIIGYDKILVMDNGAVAEYDNPENLYKQGGIFRSMCEQSQISIDEIMKARSDYGH
ncbi:ABC transporter [Atractiella rhizophila]|nr:ABC transporter [Atractiella rhizophila]